MVKIFFKLDTSLYHTVRPLAGKCVCHLCNGNSTVNSNTFVQQLAHAFKTHCTTARVCTITITPYQLGNMTAIDSFSLMIIIIITTTMFMVLSSWQSHCDSSPGSFDECRMVPSGRRPKTKPDDLGCEYACTGCQKLHPPSPFIIITQPESWYSFYRPTEVEGWVDLAGWLHTEMVYPSTDGHPSWY